LRRLAPIALLLGLVLACAQAAGAEPDELPAAPLGRVSDYAGLLSAGQRMALEAQLRRYEQEGQEPGRGGAQIAVVILPSLNGLPIEDVSIRLAERWKIGSKADDGVLLVHAPRERKVRIEVGYGLEERLPDVVAARIIREIMAPRLRTGDYGGGLSAGVAAIHQAITGRPVTGVDPMVDQMPHRQPVQRRAPSGGVLGGIGLLFVILLIFLLLGRREGGSFLLGMLLGTLFSGRGGGGRGGDGGFRGGGGRFGGGGASGDY
jgi:uncharacterized protein